MAGRSESRIKTELVQVRCTPEEKEKLKAHAAVFGISVGELCRESIFGTKPKSVTDKNAVAELASTRADQGRLGGLLKGWLVGVFESGSPTQEMVPDIKKLLKKVDETQDLIIEGVKKVLGSS